MATLDFFATGVVVAVAVAVDVDVDAMDVSMWKSIFGLMDGVWS